MADLAELTIQNREVQCSRSQRERKLDTCSIRARRVHDNQVN